VTAAHRPAHRKPITLKRPQETNKLNAPPTLPDKFQVTVVWHDSEKAATLKQTPLRRPADAVTLAHMFTIEHEFDATVVTLVDDAAAHRQDDITITAFDDCVTIEQLDARQDRVQKITLSLAQLADLTASLNLPEGVYLRNQPDTPS
jgi:hypothetical protein